MYTKLNKSQHELLLKVHGNNGTLSLPDRRNAPTINKLQDLGYITYHPATNSIKITGKNYIHFEKILSDSYCCLVNNVRSNIIVKNSVTGKWMCRIKNDLIESSNIKQMKIEIIKKLTGE